MKISLSINPKEEVKTILKFLKSVQNETKINKVVIGLSGGIDSTTVYYLLKKVYKPENIIGINLPNELIEPIASKVRGSISKFFISSGSPSLLTRQTSQVEKNLISSPHSKTYSALEKISFGNILARLRMIILFDLAKKHTALVCGTENKSERLLGYFTRFGDAASDIEPISHLYKTQVYQLAEYLKVPKNVIKATPTAGLWPGQTDEGEFGFTYREADQVMNLYLDQKISLKKINHFGLINAKKIIDRIKTNQFKQMTPYRL